MNEAELDAFKRTEDLSEKVYEMLLRWKEKKGSKATFQVLNDALCHHLVQNRDLAEKFCCDQFWDSEVDGICFPSFLTNNFYLERLNITLRWPYWFTKTLKRRPFVYQT